MAQQHNQVQNKEIYSKNLQKGKGKIDLFYSEIKRGIRDGLFPIKRIWAWYTTLFPIGEVKLDSVAADDPCFREKLKKELQCLSKNGP